MRATECATDRAKGFCWVRTEIPDEQTKSKADSVWVYIRSMVTEATGEERGGARRQTCERLRGLVLKTLWNEAATRLLKARASNQKRRSTGRAAPSA